MMRLVICFIMGIWSYGILQAQEPEFRKWVFDGTSGYQRALNTWQTGNPVDGLLSPNDNQWGFDWRLNRYISKSWGMHIGMGVAYGMKSVLKSDRIPDQISSIYQDQFFIQNPFRKKWNNSQVKLYAGIQTRLKKQRWVIIPRISLAFSRIGAEKCEFILKGKGTNALYQVKYQVKGENSSVPWRVSLNPAVQLGYKLAGVDLIVEVGYVQYFKKITYVVSSLDMYKEGQLKINEYKSRHLANNLQFNIGCSIPFGRFFM